MSLKHDFKKAEKILSSLGNDEFHTLREICGEIRSAESRLVKASEGLMHECLGVCKGLCCRNVLLDDILGMLDFAYILTLDGSFAHDVENRLNEYDGLFSSDCIFLEDGKGPCIFPGDLKPEKCLTTFCGDERVVKGDIKRLKLKFIKLFWFLALKRPGSMFFSMGFSQKTGARSECRLG